MLIRLPVSALLPLGNAVPNAPIEQIHYSDGVDGPCSGIGVPRPGRSMQRRRFLLAAGNHPFRAWPTATAGS